MAEEFGNIFAEMQMLSDVKETSYEESRKTMNDLVDFMYQQEWQEEQIGFFANLRELKPETLKAAKSFMVPDDLPVIYFPEEFQHDSLGFIQGSRVIYSGRYVYPVMDVKGNVAGWVGYDMFEEPKYLDSKNHGYKAKRTMFYGMQDLEKFYRDGYCVFVEGAVCKLAMQENGINALAFLGSAPSSYMLAIIRRFGNRAIILGDPDASGKKLAKTVKRYAPQARIHHLMTGYDFDKSRKLHPEIVDELKSLINTPFAYRKYIK